MKTKTLIIYTVCPEEMPKFAIVDGDFAHLDGTIINGGSDHSKEGELLDLLYVPNSGEFLVNFEENFPHQKVLDLGHDLAIINVGFIL